MKIAREVEKVDLIEHEWGNYLLFKSTPLIEALTSLSYGHLERHFF